MKFNPGINISPTTQPMGFQYGPNVFGPIVENRTLESIRKSLRDPECEGPDPVYSIAMDVAKKEHLEILQKLHLLFGVVTYAGGRLGNEPVRSQGHVHKISSLSNWSTPEVYEIWSGKAIIYMQETDQDDPGRCFAVEAGPGEVVIVPPGWAHATISADPEQPLTFGAWCDRDYGFEYKGIREHGGLAWFPVIVADGKINWLQNPKYIRRDLTIKKPGDYSAFGLKQGKPIYSLFEDNHDMFQFVPFPQKKKDLWEGFVP